MATIIPPSVSACQRAGERWIRQGQQVAIRVPSVIIPEEFNILLNPLHMACTSVAWSQPCPFHFDPRLFASEPQMM